MKEHNILKNIPMDRLIKMNTSIDNLNKSAARTIDILLLLSTSKEFLSLNNISENLNIPKSSVFELIRTLVKKGIIV